MNTFKCLFTFALVISGVALADPARETVACSNEHYQFVMKDSAVPTYRTASLTFSGREIFFKCQGEFQGNSASFTCEEDRAGEGRYFVGVVLSHTGSTAEVVHEQAYPLPPRSLAKLSCQITSP